MPVAGIVSAARRRSSGGTISGALVGRGNSAFSSTSGAPVTFDASAAYDRTGWYDGTDKLTVPAAISLVRPLANIHGNDRQSFAWAKDGANYVGSGKTQSTEPNIIGAITAVSASNYFQLVKDDTSTTAPTGDNTWFGIEKLDSSTKYCLISKTGSQALSAGVTTTITFDNEVADVGGWFNSASSTTDMVVPSGVSRVRVTACVAIPNTGLNEQLLIRIQKNGAVTARGLGGHSQLYAGAKYMTVTTAVMDVTPGDTFALIAGNTSAVTISSTTQVWLCIEEVPDYARTIVYRTSNLSVPLNTTTKIPWTNALTDTAGTFVANQTDLIVPSGVTQARYSFGVDYTNNATIIVFLSSRAVGAPSAKTGNGSVILCGLGMWMDVTPGDSVGLDLFGTNTTLVDSPLTWFCAEYR